MTKKFSKIKDKTKEKILRLRQKYFPAILLKNKTGGYAQFNQDLFVLDYFKFKKAGVFVDVGAYDGISNSNTFLLEKRYGWDGLAIEGNFKIFETLKKNRKCRCVLACIGRGSERKKFRIFPGYCEQMSGIAEAGDRRHEDRIKTESEYFQNRPFVIDVETTPLEKILKQNAMHGIDYLSVDIEGGEQEIVLDLIKRPSIKIQLFSIESNYGRPQGNFPGYRLIHQAGVDYFFAKT